MNDIEKEIRYRNRLKHRDPHYYFYDRYNRKEETHSEFDESDEIYQRYKSDVNRLASDVHSELVDARSQIRSLKRDLRSEISIVAKLTKDVESLTKDSEKAAKDYEFLKDDKVRMIEILGIFVAIFTFISTEFSLLRQANFAQLISLSLILSGTLILFLIFVHFTIRIFLAGRQPETKNINIQIIVITVLSSLLILAGIFTPYFFQKNNLVDLYDNNERELPSSLNQNYYLYDINSQNSSESAKPF